MGLKGDFGRLRGLAERLKKVASGSLTRTESRLMGDALAATREEVTVCFLYQRDPTGTAWAARKTIYGNYRDSNPILFDLLSCMRYEVADGKIKVTNDKYYAFYHQTGTRNMAARPFLPSKVRPGKLPERLKLAAVRALKSALSSLGGSLPTPPPYRATAKISIAPSDNDDDIDGDDIDDDDIDEDELGG